MKKNLLFGLIVAFLCVVSVEMYAQDAPVYRRSSIFMIMMEDDNLDPQVSGLVKQYFVENPVPAKFDDHGIDNSFKTFSPYNIAVSADDRTEFSALSGKKVKKGKSAENTKLASGILGLAGGLVGVEMGPSEEKYRNPVIDTLKKERAVKAWLYLKRNNFAKMMMDKWFGADKGQLGIDVIAERAFFNSTAEERNAAKELYSERNIKDAIMDMNGLDMLNNTFVTVSSFRYMTGDDMAAEILNGAAIGAQFLPRDAADAVMATAELSATSATLAIGKGYCISTTTYLYKLVWNEEVKAAIFDSASDIAKYNALDCFTLEYVGEDNAYSQVSVGKRTFEEAVKFATVRSVDKVVAKLEKNNEVFRTVTPLTQVDPVITASIGTKECVEKGDKYEILSASVNKKTGLTEYKKVGQITVDMVGNNLGEDNDTEGAADVAYTTFKGKLPKNVVPGTLIRQTK